MGDYYRVVVKLSDGRHMLGVASATPSTVWLDDGNKVSASEVEINKLATQGCTLTDKGSLCYTGDGTPPEYTLYGFPQLQSLFPNSWEKIRRNMSKLFSGHALDQYGPPSVSSKVNDRILSMVDNDAKDYLMRTIADTTTTQQDIVRKRMAKSVSKGFLRQFPELVAKEKSVKLDNRNDNFQENVRVIAETDRLAGRVPQGTRGTLRSKRVVIWDNHQLELLPNDSMWMTLEVIFSNFGDKLKPANVSIDTKEAMKDEDFKRELFRLKKLPNRYTNMINLSSDVWDRLPTSESIKKHSWGIVSGIENSYNNKYAYAHLTNLPSEKVEPDRLKNWKEWEMGIGDVSFRKPESPRLSGSQIKREGQKDLEEDPLTSQEFENISLDVLENFKKEFIVFRGIVPTTSINSFEQQQVFPITMAALASAVAPQIVNTAVGLLATYGVNRYFAGNPENTATPNNQGSNFNSTNSTGPSPNNSNGPSPNNLTNSTALTIYNSNPQSFPRDQPWYYDAQKWIGNASANVSNTIANAAPFAYQGALVAGGAAIAGGLLYGAYKWWNSDKNQQSREIMMTQVPESLQTEDTGNRFARGIEAKYHLSQPVDPSHKMGTVEYNMRRLWAPEVRLPPSSLPDIDVNDPYSYRLLVEDENQARQLGLQWASSIYRSDAFGAYNPELGDTVKSDGIYNKYDQKLSKEDLLNGLLIVEARRIIQTDRTLRPATMVLAALASLQHDEITGVSTDGDIFTGRLPPSLNEWSVAPSQNTLVAVKRSLFEAAKSAPKLLGSYRLQENAGPMQWPLTVPMPELSEQLDRLQAIMDQSPNVWGVHSSGLIYLNHPGVEPMVPPTGDGILIHKGGLTKTSKRADLLAVPLDFQNYVFFPGVNMTETAVAASVEISPPYIVAAERLNRDRQVLGFTTSGKVVKQTPFYNDWRIDPDACAQQGVFLKRNTAILIKDDTAQRVTPLCASDLVCTAAQYASDDYSEYRVRGVPCLRPELWLPRSLGPIHAAVESMIDGNASQNDVCNAMFICALPEFSSAVGSTCPTVGGQAFSGEMGALKEAVEGLQRISNLPAQRVADEVKAIRVRINQLQSVVNTFSKHENPLIQGVWKTSISNMRPEMEALVARMQAILDSGFPVGSRIAASSAVAGVLPGESAAQLLMDQVSSEEGLSPDFHFIDTALFVEYMAESSLPLSSITLSMDSSGLREMQMGGWQKVWDENASNPRFGLVMNVRDSVGTLGLQAVLLYFDRTQLAHVCAFVCSHGSAVVVPATFVDAFLQPRIATFRILPRSSPTIRCDDVPNAAQIAPLALFRKRVLGRIQDTDALVCKDVSDTAAELKRWRSNGDARNRIRMIQNQMAALASLVSVCQSHPEKRECMDWRTSDSILSQSERLFAVGRYGEALAMLRSVVITQDELSRSDKSTFRAMKPPIDGLYSPFSTL